jgi:predicted RNA-binding protein with PUA-like domain
MAYWLLKSEPESYSWSDLVREGTTEWTGVRNPAAALHLKAMAVGDRGLFYHSGKEKAAVGVMEITRTAQQDGDEPRWVSVAVRPVEALETPVRLAAMKAEPKLAGMEMLRQSRLSVSPVSDAQWAVLTGMAKA